MFGSMAQTTENSISRNILRLTYGISLTNARCIKQPIICMARACVGGGCHRSQWMLATCIVCQTCKIPHTTLWSLHFVWFIIGFSSNPERRISQSYPKTPSCHSWAPKPAHFATQVGTTIAPSASVLHVDNKPGPPPSSNTSRVSTLSSLRAVVAYISLVVFSAPTFPSPSTIKLTNLSLMNKPFVLSRFARAGATLLTRELTPASRSFTCLAATTARGTPGLSCLARRGQNVIHFERSYTPSLSRAFSTANGYSAKKEDQAEINGRTFDWIDEVGNVHPPTSRHDAQAFDLLTDWR